MTDHSEPTTAAVHPFTCAYCTGDGVSRPEWHDGDGYQRHMMSRHHGLPAEARQPDSEALRLLRELAGLAFGPDWDYELSQGYQKDFQQEVDTFLKEAGAVPASGEGTDSRDTAPTGTMYVSRGPTPKDDQAWVKTDTGEWDPIPPPPRKAE